MRKLFLLFTFIFSIIFGVNAQTYLPATNVQATANGSDVTITWNSPGILLNEGFENGIPEDWSQIDANNDRYIWIYSASIGHNTPGSANSETYTTNIGGITPDNYLITPLVEGATSVNYWVVAHSINYPAEHYAVMASSTGTNASDFTIVFEETLVNKGNATENNKDRNENQKLANWHERTVDLPEGTKYIAFRHYNCYDQWSLYIDDITIYSGNVSNVTYNIIRNETQIATGVTETTYTDSNVENGTYTYCVQAVHEDCTAVPACIPQPVSVAAEMLSVTDLTGSVTDDAVTLNWNKPMRDDKAIEVKSDNNTIKEDEWYEDGNPTSILRRSASKYNSKVRGLTGYNIYRNNTLISQINDPDILTYIDNGVADATYNYCVEAVYNEGVAEQVCINVTVGCNSVADVKAIADGSAVNISWNAPTKNREVILSEDFTNGISETWKNIDVDGDGRAWVTETDELEDNIGEGEVGSLSAAIVNGDYVPLYPDNWLITPNVTDATEVSYMVWSNANVMYNYETYGVYTSTTSDAIDNFVEIHKENIHDNIGDTPTLRTHALPKGTKYIAFRHFQSSNQYIMLLDNITISSVSNTPVSNYTYTATRNGTEIATELTETAYVDSNVPAGNYDYCVKVVYATCTSEAACAETVTSINDKIASAIKVYPNPAKNVIYIKGDIANIVMYNSFGQKVKASLNKEQIDVTSLDNGIYFLTVIGSDNSRKVEKVIIAK